MDDPELIQRIYTTAPKPVIPRMRLKENDARYLHRLLAADRLWALVERRWAIEAGLDPLTYQQWTARATRIRHDIEHLALRMGWDLDEPLREDP